MASCFQIIQATQKLSTSGSFRVFFFSAIFALFLSASSESAIRMYKPDQSLPHKEEKESNVVSPEENLNISPDPVTHEGTGLGFFLSFYENSAELLPESLPYISRLGEVLGQSENLGKFLLVVGHSSAVGTASQNKRLSMRRALAVRKYLVSEWNIDFAKLKVDGRGDVFSLENIDPRDPLNDRVEFFALN